MWTKNGGGVEGGPKMDGVYKVDQKLEGGVILGKGGELFKKRIGVLLAKIHRCYLCFKIGGSKLLRKNGGGVEMEDRKNGGWRWMTEKM